MRQLSRVALTLVAVAITAAPRLADAQGATGTCPPAAAAQGAGAAIPPANPSDVRSLDAILGALYDVISGPAARPRDWARFRSLFAPGARLIPTRRGADGVPRPVVMTPDEFAEQAAPRFAREAFYEREIGRRVDRFGAVVHVMSAYDSKRAPNDARPFTRGVNSIQLFNAGDRWYVVTIFWDAERPGTRIPGEYLKSR